MGFFKRMFGGKEPEPEYTDEELTADFEGKQAALEKLLGPMHDVVGHAIIPFLVGGTVHMYYFRRPEGGTAMATMELIDPDGDGPAPGPIRTYELVACTKHPFVGAAGDDIADVNQPFNALERRMCGLFTAIGNYTRGAVIEPGDTSELPGDTPADSACMVFDAYPGSLSYRGRRHGLLLCMEIFRDEMELARAQGSAELFKRLKDAGHFPFSDMDRESVAQR